MHRSECIDRGATYHVSKLTQRIISLFPGAKTLERQRFTRQLCPISSYLLCDVRRQVLEAARLKLFQIYSERLELLLPIYAHVCGATAS
jgi:hypothetical protein